MKCVLITGAGSYVGAGVRRRLEREYESFRVDELDVRGDSWRQSDFSSYDAVFHVAGIAHVSTDPSMADLYMRVNRDLAVEVGEKAKAEGVSQLLFMSSSIVYGDSTPHKELQPITRETPLRPENFYGDSKRQAEDGLRALESDAFSVAILRCPMIYGPGCTRGNFPTLVKYARKLPIFPDVENRRSMLYLGNLAELVAQLVKRGEGGTYLPQNSEYTKTSEMVRLIGAISGNRVRLTRAFNPVLDTVFSGNAMVRKAFGNLYYDQACSDFGFDYRPYSLIDSICEIAVLDGWV